LRAPAPLVARASHEPSGLLVSLVGDLRGQDESLHRGLLDTVATEEPNGTLRHLIGPEPDRGRVVAEAGVIGSAEKVAFAGLRLDGDDELNVARPVGAGHRTTPRARSWSRT